MIDPLKIGKSGYVENYEKKPKKIWKIMSAGFIVLLIAITVGFLYYPQVKSYVNYISRQDITGITSAVLTNTGWKYPDTQTDPESSWNNEANVESSDDSDAVSDQFGPEGEDIILQFVHLIREDGNYSSTNYGNSSIIPESDTTWTYGGSNDLWNASWSAEEINNSNFGVALKYTDEWGSYETGYLELTNFGFDIPSDAEIEGIEVEVEHANSGSTEAEIDYVQMKVYYNTDNKTVKLDDVLNGWYAEDEDFAWRGFAKWNISELGSGETISKAYIALQVDHWSDNDISKELNVSTTNQTYSSESCDDAHGWDYNNGTTSGFDDGITVFYDDSLDDSWVMVDVTEAVIEDYNDGNEIISLSIFHPDYSWGGFYDCSTQDSSEIVVGYASDSFTFYDNPDLIVTYEGEVPASPKINLERISPIGNINATQNEFFNITVNVSCLDADCGDINVSFDLETDSTEDLISYWKLDETSGDVIDSHGDNDGTNHGATRGVSGKINDAYEFDGDNDYVDLPSSAVNTLNSISVSAWVKTSASSEQTVIMDIDEGEDNFVIFGIRDENADFYVSVDGDRSTELNFPSDPDDGNWHHIAAFYNASSGVSKLFLDGVEKANGTDEGLGNLNLGYNPRVGADPRAKNYFNGKIDEVGIWSRALTEEEISELYNDGEGLSYSFEKDKGLIPTTPGETPFYTNLSSNPYTINLDEGESQEVTAWVNATGDIDTTYSFFEYANLTNNMSISNITSEYDVTIVEKEDTTPPTVSIIYPTTTTYSNNVTQLNYTASDETELSSCWWTDDEGVTNNSVTCGQNVTGQNWGEGSTTLTVYTNDTSNNLNSDSVTFSVSYPSEEKFKYWDLGETPNKKLFSITDSGKLNMTNGSDWWTCGVNNSGSFKCN